MPLQELIFADKGADLTLVVNILVECLDGDTSLNRDATCATENVGHRIEDVVQLAADDGRLQFGEFGLQQLQLYKRA